jgi:geranylgeranyl diphosphate synthase type I
MDSHQMQDNNSILKSYVSRISEHIGAFLQEEIAYWKTIDDSITPPLEALSAFISSGGKMLRPAFCFLGYRIQGKSEIGSEIISAGSALEMLHNFALVHDDFMDRADTRRGNPTVHKYLEQLYSKNSYSGDIEHFSNSVAILAGDFAFTYADRFARTLPVRCLDVYDALKVELFAGQQMDLDAVYRTSITKEDVSRIAQYKSGKYTIERPLQLGAVLANENADARLWNEFGRPLGEAFQLRDDVLGIFGDESLTGKPVGDDIREGKFTLLIAEAIERTRGTERELIDRRGQPDITDDEIEKIVDIIESSGANKAVESRIDELYNDSIKVLEDLKMDEESLSFAKYLAKYVCWRHS